MTAVLILIILASVPLAGIFSYTWLRAKRLDAEGGPAVKKMLAAMQTETDELKARVDVLESIATGLLPEGEAELKKLLPAPGSGHSSDGPSSDG
jgi:hypothetical protein